jgi:hypothetical protein
MPQNSTKQALERYHHPLGRKETKEPGMAKGRRNDTTAEYGYWFEISTAHLKKSPHFGVGWGDHPLIGVSMK